MKYQVCWRGGKRRRKELTKQLLKTTILLSIHLHGEPKEFDLSFFLAILRRAATFVFWHGGQCWGVVGGRETDGVAFRVTFAVGLALGLAAGWCQCPGSAKQPGARHDPGGPAEWALGRG